MIEALQLPILEIGKLARESRGSIFSEPLYDAPFVLARDIHKAMTVNYRKLSAEFDQHCEQFNLQVDLYNDDASLQEQKKRTITELRTKHLNSLARSRKVKKHDPDPTAWNELVHEFNTQENTNYPLKRKQPLKDSYDVLLATLLKYYAAQLTDNNRERRKRQQNTIVKLPRLVTNSYRISQYKQDGFIQSNKCPRTILRQIKRMEAAGILQHISHGAEACSEIIFNPKLIKIRHNRMQDNGSAMLNKSPKKTEKQPKSNNCQCAQNQLPNQGKCTKCTVLDSPIPGTLKLKPKRKEAERFDLERNGSELPKAVELEHNWNTQIVAISENDAVLQNVKKIEIPAFAKEKNQVAKKTEPFLAAGRKAQAQSIELLSTVDEIYKLAGELAAHKFDHYEQIPVELLQWEVDHGTLDRDDFKLVVINDFIKSFASLYVNIDDRYEMQPFHWSEALKLLQNNHFKLFTGQSFDKMVCLDKLLKYRRMIKIAAASFRRRRQNYPRFAFEYLKRGHKLSFWNLEDRVNRMDEQSRKRRIKRDKDIAHILKIDLAIKTERQMKRLRNDFNRARAAVKKYLDPANKDWNRERLDQYCSDKLLKAVSSHLNSIILDIRYNEIPNNRNI